MITPEQKARRDHDRKLREVYNLKVFVVGGGFQYIKMFHDAGFKGALSVDDADILCFTGGEDVDPSFYGEKPHPKTYSNLMRDNYEAAIYGEALASKKAMVGICRGAQFLNVMNGGKLWQHVNNHAVGRTHPVIDFRSGQERFNMTSTHHQMMIPADSAEILAACSESTRKESEKEIELYEEDQEHFTDVEAVWYADTNCLCFQPHPEFQQGDCQDYFLELVDELVMPAC